MANITSKPQLNETPADDDKFYIVDVSDTTDNANGSDKHVTRANLVGGLQVQPSEGAFVDGDKTKLDGIETNADVTDATNVQAAGALMDSELTDLAGIKALDTTTVQLKPSEGAFVNGDKTKLDGIETSADVTDATNVDAAGAVMNSDVDAKGDIFVATADNTVTRLAVGSDNQVLTADSQETSGIKWATPAAGGGSSEYVTMEEIKPGILPTVAGWSVFQNGTNAAVTENINGHIQIDLSTSFANPTSAGINKKANYWYESEFDVWDLDQIWNFVFAKKTHPNAPCEMWFGSIDRPLVSNA